MKKNKQYSDNYADATRRIEALFQLMLEKCVLGKLPFPSSYKKKQIAGREASKGFTKCIKRIRNSREFKSLNKGELKRANKKIIDARNLLMASAKL